MRSVVAKFCWLVVWLLVGPACREAGAQNGELTVHTGKEVALTEFFRQVEQVSDYLFQYKDQDVAGKTVSLSMEKVTIQQLMDRALKGTGLGYRVKQRYVIIEKVAAEKGRKGGRKKKEVRSGAVFR